MSPFVRHTSSVAPPWRRTASFPDLAGTATLREHYRISCLILALSPTLAWPTFPIPILFPTYFRYHHHHYLFSYLEKRIISSLLSFLPHFFSPLYIYSIMLSIVPSFPNFQHKRILRKGSRFRFALVVYFHRGIFRPGSFRIDPRYPADGIAQREFSKRGEVTLRISRVFSFLFFPFLSLFPPGCLAAFPPPESGWCPILGINRVARSVCQMLHVL